MNPRKAPANQRCSLATGCRTEHIVFLLIQAPWAPFYQHALILIQSWISNHMCKMWDEITYPFISFNGAAVEVSECISNFTPYFIMDIVMYPWNGSIQLLTGSLHVQKCMASIGRYCRRPRHGQRDLHAATCLVDLHRPDLKESIVNIFKFKWICNCIHYKAWDEMTYPFPNFNGCTVEVWEWISNLISHFIGRVITYACWDMRTACDTASSI